MADLARPPHQRPAVKPTVVTSTEISAPDIHSLSPPSAQYLSIQNNIQRNRGYDLLGFIEIYFDD
jgi:hypothetical protein